MLAWHLLSNVMFYIDLGKGQNLLRIYLLYVTGCMR